MEQNTGMNHHRALAAVTLLALSTAALWGSAYLTAQVPAEISIGDLR